MPKPSRRWVKLYCYELLHGSVSYQLTEAEQAVWIKLLCLAGLCGHEGIIADHDLRPFPHDFISHEIHTTLELLEETLRKCKAEGRISEDGNGIHITNWAKYQSEYGRQRPYRIAKHRDQLELPEVIRVNQENEERIARHQAMKAKQP